MAAAATAEAATMSCNVLPRYRTEWLNHEAELKALIAEIAVADAKLAHRPPETITVTSVAKTKAKPKTADAKGDAAAADAPTSILLSRRACMGSLVWATSIAGDPATTELSADIALPALRWIGEYLTSHDGVFYVPAWTRVTSTRLANHHAVDADIKAIEALWTDDRALFFDVATAAIQLDIRQLHELLVVKTATVLRFEYSSGIAAALSA